MEGDSGVERGGGGEEGRKGKRRDLTAIALGEDATEAAFVGYAGVAELHGHDDGAEAGVLPGLEVRRR